MLSVSRTLRRREIACNVAPPALRREIINGQRLVSELEVEACARQGNCTLAVFESSADSASQPSWLLEHRFDGHSGRDSQCRNFASNLGSRWIAYSQSPLLASLCMRLVKPLVTGFCAEWEGIRYES